MLLVSRSPGKLEALAREVEQSYGVRAKALVFDFAESTAAEEATFYEETLPRCIASAPVEGSVGLLVNNVGVGDEAPFGVDEVVGVTAMLKVNCAAMVHMTKCLLPLLKHRKGGAIINVSSGSALQPAPYLATYASTKAFGAHFSKSCSRECQGTGVTVLGVAPYYMCGTGLYPNAKPSLNAPPPSAVVRGAFQSLGLREVASAYWGHAAMAFLFGVLFEDPVAGPLIERAAAQGKGRVIKKGSMLAIQQHARDRSRAKQPAMWAAADAARAAHLAKLGCAE